MTFRKIMKVASLALAAAVLLVLLGVGGAYGVTELRLRKTHAVQPAAVPIPSDEAAIARGRHLATTRGCTDCHGPDLAGRAVVEDPLIGRMHGPNITSGRGGLPTDFADADYVRAIRHGLARGGRALVLMPSMEYSYLSDEDLGALIAFLRAVPPVDRERGPVSYGPLGRVLLAAGEMKLAAEEIDHAAPRPARVAEAATVEYGRYLAATCTGCHGENFSGGKIPGGAPDWPAASNLTPHETGAITSWTEADFFRLLRERRRPDNTELHPVMPEGFAHLSDVETQALWRYLRSVPPVPTGQRTH